MRLRLAYLFVLIFVLNFSEGYAQANLHYRTRNGNSGNGNWNTFGSTGIWETSPTGGGGNWQVATAPPDNTSLTITIRQNRNVTIPAGYNAVADQLSIEGGPQSLFTIASGGSLTIVDDGLPGTTDMSLLGGSLVVEPTGNLIINAGATFSRSGGTITVSGTVSNAGSFSGTDVGNTFFQSGGRYRHLAATNGAVPLANWDANSTLEVAGYTGSVVANPAGNWGQVFGHVQINLTNLASGTVNFAGRLTTIAGNVLITSTGGPASTGNVVLINGAPVTINVSGNFITSADTRTNITNNGGSSTLTVNGSMTNNGSLTLANGNGSSSLMINGSLTNNGTLLLSTGNGAPTLTVNSTFTNTGTFTKTTGTGSPNLVVRSHVTNSGSFTPGGGGTVFFDGTSIVTGSPNFYDLQLNADRTLIIPSGNVGVAGHLNFDSASNFSQVGGILFNGTTDQEINNNGLEFYLIRVNKASGALNMNHTLPLHHLLDIQSATPVNSNNNLIILSQGNTTDMDASIGPIAAGGQVNGNVTVQRYMHPFGYSHNRYISVPVAGATPSSQFSDNFQLGFGSIRFYDESVTGDVNNGYKNLSLSGTLQRGRGYLAWMYNGSIQITWDVVGTIHQGSVSLPVSYTPSAAGNDHDGWNLIGNPYPSAISWSDDPAKWTMSPDISPVIYVTDMLGNEFIPFNFSDNSGEGGEVAMGQAFWVKANAGSPSLVIHEAAKTSSGSGEFYRKRPASSEQLIVKITHDTFQDRAYLKLNPSATADFDHLFDALKLRNESLNLYLVDDAGRSLVMHTLGSLTGAVKVPIGIEAFKPGAYTLSFSNVENFSAGSSLYLVDTWEQRVVPVSGPSYTFTIRDITMPLTDRFYLSVNPTLPERSLAEMVQVYPNPVTEYLSIQLPEDMPAKVSLMNGNGGLITTGEFQGKLDLDLRDQAKGVYVLRIITGEGTVIKKVVKY
jgi:hypothetical protein